MAWTCEEVSSVSSGLTPAYPDKLLSYTTSYTGMLAAKRYRTRSSARATRSHTSQDETDRFFPGAHRTTPGTIVAVPRVSGQNTPIMPDLPASPGSSSIPDSLQETPAIFRPDMSAGTNSPLRGEMSRLDGDIRTLLQALPTKQEIEALIRRVEEAQLRDIQAVRERRSTSSQKGWTIGRQRYPHWNTAWQPWSDPTPPKRIPRGGPSAPFGGFGRQEPQE